MMRALSAGLACVVAVSTAARAEHHKTGRAAAELAAMLEGRWESVETGPEGPVSGRTYVRVDAPNMEGQVLALLRHGPGGVDTPATRVSLRRFRDGEGAILNDYIYFRDAEHWGDLTKDLTPLTALTEDHVQFNADCTMTWRADGGGFVGETTPGACVSTRVADEPVVIEARHTLSPDQFVHASEYFTLDGPPYRDGETAPEIFERVD